MIVLSTTTVQERAPNVINSTTLCPRVAVELKPNVCVIKLKIKLKMLHTDLILTPDKEFTLALNIHTSGNAEHVSLLWGEPE